MDFIAGELDIEVPSLSFDAVESFFAETEQSYRKSAFFTEDSIYRQRNDREYPWERRVLEFRGKKIYPYDTHQSLNAFVDTIEKLPVSKENRTIILIVQKTQGDYDFNFHFDAELGLTGV